MSQENVETVRRFIDALDRAVAVYWDNPRSIAEAVKTDTLEPEGRELWGLIDPDMVWNAGGFGTFHGGSEIAAFWDDVFDVAEDYRTTLGEVADCGGDQVLAAIDREITAKGSGIHTTIPVFAVFTVREGLIAGCDEYRDRAEALEAARLSE